MGRKPQEGTEFSSRRVHVNVLFTPEEYTLLRDCAEVNGTTLAGFIRRALKEKMLLDGMFYVEVNGEFRRVGGLL